MLSKGASGPWLPREVGGCDRGSYPRAPAERPARKAAQGLLGTPCQGANGERPARSGRDKNAEHKPSYVTQTSLYSS